LPDTPPEGARHVAETIRAAIVNLAIAHPSGHERLLTVSIGCVALVPPQGAQFQQFIELADQALYRAKRDGRNCVRLADSDLQPWSPGSARKRLLARIEAHRIFE
jgi:diguanylate cyclase (GGDEF)-like protein